MESSMKVVSSVVQVFPEVERLLDASVPAANAFELSRVIPVAQAQAAIGDAVGTAELAQRLTATLAMLWSDVVASDLFLPDGDAGELQGLRDPIAGRVLLHAA